MKLPLRRSVLFSALMLVPALLPRIAAADCPTPATTGIVICQPSANSTIFQVPHFEAAATPASGSITSMSILIDGKNVFTNSGDMLSVFQGGVSNGKHALAIEATDSFGRHLRASESFTVIGNIGFCPPSGVGMFICAPTTNGAVSQNLEFSLGFKGQATTSHVRIYIDNKRFADFDPPFSPPGEILGTAGPVSAGQHNMTAIAWDIHGQTVKNSVVFKAFFDGGCPPKGNVCTPVLTPDTPQDGEDVKSPFLVSAHVDFNTVSISAIKAYLDGRVVAESFGPAFHQNLSAAKGTHILTLQAWDVDGRLYRVTENVNVQ